MRKKCVSCGLICFLTDESCKRCGSNQLEIISAVNRSLTNNSPKPAKQNLSPNYLKHFFFAVGIEFVALILILPGLASMGMRHTANAPTSIYEMLGGLFLLVSHFPTLFVNLALTMLTGIEVFVFLTPITQIAFWTYVLARLNYRKMRKQQVA